jgi:predicted branched-subunit amino acid permease
VKDFGTARDAFRRGVRELLPLTPGVAAWGLVTGVAMVKAGLTVPQALGLSLLAYAGSAQLAALPLIVAASPVWVVLLTCVVVNLRFVVYSAVTRPHLGGESASRRIGLGYLVGDVMFARFAALVQREPDYPHKVAYYFGGASTNWVAWQITSIAGILAADSIPLSWGLELAGTLALVALLVPLCVRVPALAGIAAAAAIAVLAHDWPLKLGMLTGTVGGIAVALLADRLTARGSGGGDERGGPAR